MNILHIVENIDNTYGGPAKSIPYLIKYLQRHGIANKIISIQLKENEQNDVCLQNNIPIISVPSEGPKALKYSRKFCKLIENEINDKTILHTHSLWNYPPYCAFKISQQHRRPLMISIRGNLYDWNINKSKWKKRMALSLFQMEMFQKASCLHATEINELHAIRKLGIKTPIALIPNGIEVSEFDNLIPKKKAVENLSLNTSKKYILFMSRIDPKKGLDYLIDSYLSLEKKFPNWELLVAGPIYDQKYFENIVKKIKNQKLTSKIHFFGMVNGQKRLNLFAASDLFILPAHTENFGMVIGEAMAAKLPVITTTGTPWKILHEKNAGWWIDLNTDNVRTSLKEAMEKSEIELKAMGKNSYKIIEKNFSWKEVALKMQRVYCWLLGDCNMPTWVYKD